MPKLPLRKRLRRLGLNVVSLRIGLGAGAAVLVLGLILASQWAPLTASMALLASFIVLVLTYGMAHLVLHQRMMLAQTTLRQIRKHQFDNLDAAQIDPRDELDALTLQVYRTGLVLEKEIRELRKVENYRREFLGNVSHELKTPIFAIQGFAETLIDGAIHNENVNEVFMQKILRNAKRLTNLAQDLSAIARIEMGELKMNFEPFSLARLIDEVLDSLEPVAAGKSVHLHVHVVGELPTAWGDRERIAQVLTNLVDNAIKYNDPEGQVEVVARALSDGSLKISVVDDGIGIPPQHIQRLTERFFRVDTSRSRVQGGTGLGLAIVKHILAAHGQALLVESTPGQGSTFGFGLKSAKAERPAQAPRSKGAEVAPKPVETA
ncbi:MAG: ATP-binding protein [Rhodothermales bacterium]